MPPEQEKRAISPPDCGIPPNPLHSQGNSLRREPRGSAPARVPVGPGLLHRHVLLQRAAAGIIAVADVARSTRASNHGGRPGPDRIRQERPRAGAAHLPFDGRHPTARLFD